MLLTYILIVLRNGKFANFDTVKKKKI